MSMLKRIFFVGVLSLLFAFCSSAQIPSPLIFSRLTKKDGLASNTTFRTVQDKQGFLWIATQNGLQCYDGNRFLTFRHTPNNASSIPENNVNVVFIDSKGRLWVLFDKDIGIFNTSNFTFSEAKIDSSTSQVKKIMEDDKG